MDSEAHRAATRLAYDRLAPVWDETDDNLWNEALERTMVRRLLPAELTGMSVLDAGCAAGAHAEWLAAHGAQVTALDLSSAMVRAAQARLGAGALLVGDLDAGLPFVDEVFDGVLCSLVLHYLADMAPALREFRRVLRPGGWLLLTLDHPANFEDRRDDYFATRLITDTWMKKGVAVEQTFWRRPLEATVDDLAAAGFLLERIGETQPDEEARRRFPEEAAMIEGSPTFIGYLAVPAARRTPPG
jgi:SAM-dependent methyltransferase